MSDKKTALARIKVLVDKFQKQISYYKSNSYKEDQLRVDFIDPFWEALGWDVKNEKDLPQTYREVIYEDRLKSREEDNITTKEPDYAFTVNGERKFFLEVKKPAVMVKNDPKPAIQARLYGWNARLPISLVSDFEELAVYDCNKYAKAHDKAGDSRLKYIEFTNYEKEFDFIYDTFSRDAVFDGSLDKYVKIDKKGSETVDAEFLKQMNHWRKLLAEGIAQKNPEISEEEIRFAVQMLLDRIIFLRICEDREIEKYKTLQSIARSTKGIHTQLFSYFKTAAAKYNSNLFEFQTKDTFTENLNVPDVTWQIIILNLYFPNSPFLFKFIPADVLGNVYEQFLGKQIILKGRLTREIDIDYKPEVRKAGGVYYTPQYIVSYIIQNTIGKLLQGKTPEEVDKLKIVDPSCGSGSFLIQAYQYLLGWYQDYYYKIAQKQAKIRLNAKTATKNEKLIQTKVVGTLIHPDGKLTTAEKKRILLNSIYGVDIDEQAVEVTKLNLLLKALEGETNATIEEQTKVRKQKVLADLDKNIRAGNSLIGKDYKDKSVKPFDWEAAFPDVFRQGGFDAVIGNPPYGAYFQENEIKYLNKNFKYQDYQLDSYLLFLELFNKLLNKQGYTGVIIPNTWLLNLKTPNIRKYVFNNYLIVNIVHYLFKVFRDAVVDTEVLILKNSKFETELDNEIKITVIDKYFNEATHKIKQSKWVDFDGKSVNIFDRIEYNELLEKLNNLTKIDKLAKITQGCKPFQVGKGNPKQTQEIVDKKPFVLEYKKDDSFRPLLRGSLMNRYVINWNNNYFIKLGDWLAEPRYSANYDISEKIVIRQTGDSLIATLDSEKFVVRDNLYTIILLNNTINIKFILGLINSKFLNWYYQNIINNEKGEALAQIKRGHIAELPIPEIKNKTEKALHDKIVGLVEEMLDLQIQVRQPSLLPNKHAEIEDDIRYTDAQIDKCVYELYGLTPEEIKIVEN